MVNAPSQIEAPERRERPRAGAEHAPALGEAKLNPFGDLVTLQHLSARAAKGLKPVFETILRRPVRVWAEPLEVQRWNDYRAERGDALTAWQSLGITPGKGRALLVIDAALLLGLLDAFFGGEGEAPAVLPEEFSPAAEAMSARLARAIATPLAAAWEPVVKIAFDAVEAPLAAAPDLGGEAMIVTRFGFAVGDGEPLAFDLLYPVSALKPHGDRIAAKVQPREAEVEPEWRNGLTRALMQVRLPVRSVLAEPRISLGRLIELQVGDVLPIEFGTAVPVMVGKRRLGLGQAGTSNGRAAVKLVSIDAIQGEDFA